MVVIESRNLVEVQKVRQVYGKSGGPDLLVLDDVDLTLKENEIVGLLGRSGSGKSTLLRSIAGLVTPTQGVIEFPKIEDGQRATVSMAFQTFALFREK